MSDTRLRWRGSRPRLPVVALLTGLLLCFSAVSAAQLPPPPCAIRWLQRMPLTDASFTVQPSLKPVLSTSFHITVPFDAEVLHDDREDCRDELASPLDVTLDTLSFAPQNCSCAACQPEEITQFREVASALLPKGSVARGASSDPDASSARRNNVMVIAFHSLPVGRAFVFHSEATIVCPVRTLVRSVDREEPALVRSELVLVIRPAVPECALVTERYELLRAAKEKITAAAVHRRNLRGGLRSDERAAAADIDELSINRDGLRLRVLLLGDRFQLRNVSSRCRLLLGSSPIPRRRVSECASAPTGSDNDNGVDDDGGRCALEHAEAVRDLQLAIAEGFSCSPLPCLHENPIFNVSHLAAPDAASGAVELEHSNHQPRSNRWAREILFGTHNAAATVTIDPNQWNALHLPSPRPVNEMVIRWKALASASQTEGGLPRILRAADVHVTENLAVIEVPASELRARGFFLPSYRHLGWHFADHNVAVSPELDELGRDWRATIGGERSIFHITLTLPTWSTSKRGSQGTADGRAETSTDGEDRETLFSRVISLASLDNSALTPRGALLSSIMEPYPSLRYVLKYLDGEKGDRWEEIPLASQFPIELSTFLSSASNDRSSSNNRHQFGFFAPHFRDGFDLILAPDSKDELMVRHHAAFLQCPSPPVRCAGYYGDMEGPLAAFFRTDWITRVEANPVFRKVLVLHVSAIPRHLGVESFGKPVHIGIRLPLWTTSDDVQYPLPLNATKDHRSWYTIQLVSPPSPDSAAAGHNRHEEL